ncbi:MAG: imidazole glycerol phosphate synthase subunit HisH [Planctomycetaceae bacterium]
MTTLRIQIVDYRLGNLFSIRQACQRIGIDAVVSSSPQSFDSVDGIILPGVGAFGNAMESLRELNLISSLRTFAASGKPLLGICLGMQLLFDESEEFGRHEGLGILPGTVRRIPDQTLAGRRLRVPNVGWNPVARSNSGVADRVLEGIADDEFMYFVHSYCAVPADSADVLTSTTYGSIRYCSAVRRGHILGVQFHPEKSAGAGLRILKNWARELSDRSAPGQPEPVSRQPAKH